MSSSFDPKLTALKLGYTFDYNLKTWIVEEVYHYKWGNNFSSVEYKIYSGDEEAYLEVEDDGILKLLFSKDIDLYLSPTEFTAYGTPKKTIGYKGKTYSFNEKFESQARNDDDDYWESFYLWDYFDSEGEEFISVENWDGDIEACHGHKVDELEISSILPGDPNRVRDRNLKKKFGYDSTFSESEDNPTPVKIILFMVILVVFIILMSRGCGRGTYIHTGHGGRYNNYTGGGSSWTGGGGSGGGFRGGGGGFGK